MDLAREAGMGGGADGMASGEENTREMAAERKKRKRNSPQKRRDAEEKPRKRGRPRKVLRVGIADVPKGVNPEDPQWRRRIYNRRYMRKWRSRPGNLEGQRRKKRNDDREINEATPRKNPAALVEKPRAALCAICHSRKAVEQISRLVASEVAASGYVEVRIPYCGKC
jgi:hypothetical protein